MRALLLGVAWVSLVGSVVDGLIGLYALYIVLAETSVAWLLSIEELFKHYIAWLYWVKALARYLLPEATVLWIFALPALVVLPVRVLVSVWVGNWALKKAQSYTVETGP